MLIVERDHALGGILQQCIHPGFGLHIFNEELTGPEYAYRFIGQIKPLGIDVLLNTMVLDIHSDDKRLYAVNRERGVCNIGYKSLVLAMGCRERTRGQSQSLELGLQGYLQLVRAKIHQYAGLYGGQGIRHSRFRRYRHDYGKTPYIGRGQG